MSPIVLAAPSCRNPPKVLAPFKSRSGWNYPSLIAGPKHVQTRRAGIKDHLLELCGEGLISFTFQFARFAQSEGVKAR